MKVTKVEKTEPIKDRLKKQEVETKLKKKEAPKGYFQSLVDQFKK